MPPCRMLHLEVPLATTQCNPIPWRGRQSGRQRNETAPAYDRVLMFLFGNHGAGDQTRTDDLLITNSRVPRPRESSPAILFGILAIEGPFVPWTSAGVHRLGRQSGRQERFGRLSFCPAICRHPRVPAINSTPPASKSITAHASFPNAGGNSGLKITAVAPSSQTHPFRSCA